jgi:alkyl sulfatase BDS1-like metallo-beta-lactamase superfamily hydrolase
MTIVEGESVILVIDPLLARETATAAIELYYQNRPKKPVVAVVYRTHTWTISAVLKALSIKPMLAMRAAITGP